MKILKTLGCWNYASFQTSVRNIQNNTSAIAREASLKHLLYRLTLRYFLTFTWVGNLAHLPGPTRARTCDHLIMSQVSNSYNSPSSNHNVNICKIKGYELSASIPAIAQAMYGIYRTAKYDSESSPISYT